MYIAIGVLLVMIGAAVIFFNIPFSPLKNDFTKDMNALSERSMSPSSRVFTKEDIVALPAPVQKYFRSCGFIGKPIMSGMKAAFRDVPFKQGKNGPSLKIDYTQYNFVAQPQRIALIRSSLFGIPFDGYDSYIDGRGDMKGVLGKLATLFDQTGEDMNRACLVTFLSECLIVPSAALQDYISWDEIDQTHAKATITYYDISASGIFAFNDQGEMTSFTTEDRAAYNNDGTMERVSWSAICADYRECNGYRLPNVLQAVWHYKDGDLLYFDGSKVTFEYLK